MPNDIVIVDGSGSPIGFSPVSNNTLNDLDIVIFLNNTGDLIVETSGTGGNGDITLNIGSEINWTSTNRLTLNADRDIVFNSGSSINSSIGDLILNADRNIGFNSSSSIISNSGNITLLGQGGTIGAFLIGVSVDSGSSITSVSGNIDITGNGGNGSANNSGVVLNAGGAVTSTGTGISSGNINIIGNGGMSPNNNNGVLLNNGIITAVDGNIDITGTVNNNGQGIRAINNSLIQSTGTGDITLTIDTIDLSSVNIQGLSQLTINPLNMGTTIGLGNSATGTLNLDATELGNIADGFSGITIGNNTTGAIDINAVTFNDPVTIIGSSINIEGLNGGTNPVSLNANTGNIIDTSSGTDITGNVTLDGNLQPGGTGTPDIGQFVIDGSLDFVDNSTVSIQINGATTPGTDYDQIQVMGTVDITNTNLSATFGFTPDADDVFTIIDNDGTDAITGTFNSLAEGAIINLSGTDYVISYQGGFDKP